MTKKLYILLYFIALLYCPSSVLAQDSGEQKALSTVLAVMQERFGVAFNYVSTVVDNIIVAEPDKSLSLQDCIASLKTQSNLDFVFVTDKLISIKARKKILCGYLVDKDTGETLPYVTIQNGSNGTLSNDDGYFEIEVNSDEDIIQIKHIGHKPIYRAAKYFRSAAACEKIYLVANQVELTEIVVFDYLIRGVDKLDNGAYQINFNKYSMLPGLIEKDVLHAVQAFPGIQSIDESVSRINIRGGSNDQNLITWDGIKMYQTGHFFGLISMYNPNSTQKVSLRKNGSSASETDGVSGTIAMMTDNYLNPTLKGNISLNLLDGNGFIDTPVGQNASLQIAARKSISNLIETPTYSEYFKRIAQDTEIEDNATTNRNSNISFDFYDTSMRLLLNPSDKDRLQINFIHTANEVTFNESATVSGREQIRESKLNQLSIAGGIQYQRSWTKKLDTKFALYETDYILKGINANILENQRFLQENKVSETGIKFAVDVKISPLIKLTNGYHFVETKIANLDDVDDPKYILLEAEVLRTHGVFSEISLASRNKETHLNIGLRYNYLGKFKKQIWEPRLSFNQNFGPNFNLELLGEYKHQNTSQLINFQNDFLGIEKRRWQLSNDGSIPVITSKQMSVGLSYHQNGWLLDAVPFYKKVNGITIQSQGFHGPYEYARQAGAYNATGLDVLIRKQVLQGNAWFSYGYLNSTYFFNELPETKFSSNFDITHALSFGADYTINQLIFAAGLNWRTGKPYTQPVTNNEVVDGAINYKETNTDRENDYLRLDFSTRYQLNWKKNRKLQLGLSLWNVLNRDNTLNTFYQIDSEENIQEVNQSSLGITPNASARLIF